MSRTKRPIEPKQDAQRLRFEGFSTRVQSRLQDLDQKLRPLPAAQRLWDRLTNEQRRRLGPDIKVAYGRFPHAGRMWAELHQVDQYRAYLEVGKELGFVSNADFNWLMREIGEVPDPEVDSNRPSWNADIGKLRLDGEVIGTFRVMQSPSMPCLILAAFQHATWRTVIVDPLGGGEETLQEAVRYLNDRVEGIRFRTQRGGQAVSWERL